MKTYIVIALFSFYLLHLTVAVPTSCKDGYYIPIAGDKCIQCPAYYSKCNSANNGTFVSGIDGVKSGGSNYATDRYCLASNVFYNSKSNTCDPYCVYGCQSCDIDNDFCTACDSGFIWTNYACLPAVIGLQAASLALLFISLIFLIIGCCYVNKARK